MPFKCISCGLSFDVAEDFIKHKLTHQGQAAKTDKKAPACLGCGKPFPADYLKTDYSGDITCPNCGRVAKIVIQNNEVVLAVSKQGTTETEEELLKEYRKWIAEYTEAKDIIENIVPTTASLPEGKGTPAIKVTEDMLTKFHYAEAKMTDALRKRQEIHERLYKLQRPNKSSQF